MAATVQFPNFSVGRIYVSDEHGAYLYVGEAKGTVNIDCSRPIRIRLAPNVADLGWLRELAPECIEELVCHAATFEGNQLKHIAHLKELKHLQLSFCNVTDRDISELRGLSKLKTLQLNWTILSDEGLQQLQQLSALETLDLSRTRISDQGLLSISSLQHLRHLSLWDCKVTGSTLSHLAKLPALSHLWMSRTRLDDTFGQSLGLLAHLQNLEIAETQAGDQTIKALSAISLQTLDISHTKVSDSAIQTLCSMPELKHLYARETRVTKSAAELIRNNRPDLDFDYSERSLQPTLARTRQKALGL